MNKVFEFFKSIEENSQNELMVEISKVLKKNIKRFQYLLEYAMPQVAFKLSDFLNSVPEQFADMACEETFLDRMYQNGEVFEKGKVSIIESFEDGEKEMKMTFVFDKFGTLIRMIISNESISLTVLNEDRNPDLVMFEYPSTKDGCYKLVKTLKGCYSLNKAKNSSSDFENVCSFEPERLDRKSTETSDMIEHWKKIAVRDNVEI